MVPMIDLIPVIVVAIVLIGGITIVLAGMYQHIRTLEMAHRERLAMIERGIVPPPERDPEAFEQSLRSRPVRASRTMAAGIVTISFGVALAFLISLAGGQRNVGIGVGGAIAIIGVAFVINGYLAEAGKPDGRGTP
jgi:hypothetical protein